MSTQLVPIGPFPATSHASFTYTPCFLNCSISSPLAFNASLKSNGFPVTSSQNVTSFSLSSTALEEATQVNWTGGKWNHTHAHLWELNTHSNVFRYIGEAYPSQLELRTYPMQTSCENDAASWFRLQELLRTISDGDSLHEHCDKMNQYIQVLE